ncbi:MAG: hypothetical protein ACK4UT_06030 [Moraxellaceae bacterium]
MLIALALLALLAASIVSPGHAEETADASAVKVSGFASVVVGVNLDGERDQPLTYNPAIDCPCTVTNWTYNGIYQGRSVSAAPDSKIGVQVNYAPVDALDLTAQLISRGSEPRLALEWAFASYRFSDRVSVALGRMRLPIYYYSDFHDIGLAYPWITPPGEVYGWEVNNFNGGSLRFRDALADGDATLRIFGGSERVKKSGYYETFSTDRVDVRWENILGADIEWQRDWLTVRLGHVMADGRATNVVSATTTPEDIRTTSLAVNGDFGALFFLSEAGFLSRHYTSDGYKVESPSFSVGGGYRFADKWTAFLNHARYRDRSTDPAFEYFRFNSTSATLRYDINTKSDLKLQVSMHEDDSVDYSGDSHLLRVAYDIVF